jgi:2-haloacid dehalogenase
MTTALQGIRACVFDAYGTLLDVHAAVLAAGERLGDNAAPLSQLWRRKQLEYAWIRSLTGTHADFAQVTADALSHAFEVFGVNDALLHEELLEAYFQLPAFADAEACLKALRAKGRRLAVLSNGTPSMLEAALSSAGLLSQFEQIISVEDVGIYKPSRRAYRLAMQKLKVDAAPDVAFVSGNAWDAQSAAAFGFQAVWINRDGGPPERLPGKPAAVIASLEELPPLIG